MAEVKEGDGQARIVARSRTVDLAVSLMLLGLAALLGWDSWRVGMRWAEDGPQAGYFPFYLAVLMGAASLYGIGRLLFSNRDTPFVNSAQLGRVFQVLLPTLGFVMLTQVLGIYVASFILIVGFMWIIGRIKLWAALLTSLVFSAAMFATFEIAFNVIMPKGPLEAAFGF